MRDFYFFIHFHIDILIFFWYFGYTLGINFDISSSTSPWVYIRNKREICGSVSVYPGFLTCLPATSAGRSLRLSARRLRVSGCSLGGLLELLELGLKGSHLLLLLSLELGYLVGRVKVVTLV